MAPSLYEPFKIGGVEIRNRIGLAPLTRGRANVDHSPTAIQVEYYKQRSGAGLIVTEATGITRQGLGWYKAPGIWSEEKHVPGWKAVTDAVHAEGGKISLQLWHMGRQAHSDVTGEPIVAPTAIALSGEITAVDGEKKPAETPHELTTAEVESIVEDYGKAAENARKANFDFVEIHSANGYLGDMFLQSKTNKRTDKYGGDKEGRLTFMKEVIDRISKVYDRKHIGIRFSPHGAFGEMGSADNFEVFDLAIQYCADQGLGYISLMDGTGFGLAEVVGGVYDLERAKAIIKKAGTETTLIGNVGYTKETAEKAVASGHAEMILFGRPFISNPDLPTRFEKGLELAPDAEYEDWWTKRDADGYTTFEKASV